MIVKFVRFQYPFEIEFTDKNVSVTIVTYNRSQKAPNKPAHSLLENVQVVKCFHHTSLVMIDNHKVIVSPETDMELIERLFEKFE